MSHRCLLALPALCLGAALPAQAMEFETSGFASLIAGRSFGACVPDNTIGAKFADACSRFIADWSRASVYTPQLSVKPESRLGLQATLRHDDTLSATTQVVGRSVDGGQLDLEWAYLTWKPAPAWTIQAGRKRLPLFYFSDFQDVGYAYGWLRPPPDVYGWDVVNYNGANVSWQSTVAGFGVKADVFAGAETSKDNAYSTLMYSGEPKDVHWKNIRGAAIEVSRDVYTGRAVFLTNDYRQRDRNTGQFDVLTSGRDLGKQRIYGLSFNIDADPWLLRSEYSVFDRSDFQYKAKAYMVAVGHRFDKLTPMVTLSGYKETTPFPDDYAPLVMRSASLTLRYEVGSSSAIKLQWDRYLDRSPAGPFSGSASALAIGFDTVF